MTGWLRRMAPVTFCILAAVTTIARAASYADADSFFARSEWGIARSEYQSLIKESGTDQRAWLGLARSCAKLSEWQAATDAYEKLITLGPVEASVRTEYGDALRQLGRLRDAVAQYSIAMEGAPVDTAAMADLSHADDLYTAGQYTDALDAYEDVVAKYPNNMLAWLRMARIHSQLGDYSAALLAYESIEERGGMDAELRLEYGDALRKGGKLDQAVAQYSLAMKDKESKKTPSSREIDKAASSPQPGSKPGNLAEAPMAVEVSGVRTNTQSAPVILDSVYREQGSPMDLSGDVDLRMAESPPSFRARSQVVMGEGTEAPSGRQTTSPRGNTKKEHEAKPKRQDKDSPSPSQSEPASQDTSVARETGIQQATPERRNFLFQEKSTGESEKVNDWLDQAKKLIAEKRWAEAVYAFQQLMKERDLSMDEMLEYGDALAENRDVEEAEAIFNTVLHDDAENVDAKLGLAKVLAYSGKLDEAMYLLDQVQETADSDKQARLARAKAYFANDYVQETWRDVGDLLATDPDNVDIVEMINKGAPWPEIKALLQSRPGNEEIIELIEEMNRRGLEQLGFVPADDAARAEQLFYEGNYEAALDEFVRILKDDPKNLTALKRSGDIYRWEGRWQDALWAYEQYMELEPDDPEATLRHAQIIMYSGDYEAALSELSLLVTNPDLEPEIYEEAMAAYGIALAGSGRHAEALDVFVEALTLNPDNSEVRIAYADALAAMKRYKEAFEQYDLVAQSDPDALGAVYGKARAYSWMGDQATAQEMFDTLLNEEAWYVPARIGKAYSLLWGGQRNQAFALAQEAAQIRPDDPELQKLYDRLGETPPPVLISGYRQSHDSEDNDYTGMSSTLLLPLNSRGTQAIIEHEDFKIDNTNEAEESAGTNTRLTLSTPVGRAATLSVNTSHLNVSNGADPKLDGWNWGAALRTDPVKEWSAGAAYNSSLWYDTTQIARNDIRVKESQVYVNHRLDKDTDFLVSCSWADLSDNNSRNSWVFRLSRRAFYMGSGTLTYGVSHYRLNYRTQTNSGYWDPDRYHLTEVYADWFDQTNRRWMFDAGVGIGYADAADSGSDYTYRYNLGLRTRALHPNSVLRTGYEYNEAGNNATNAPNYNFGSWYMTAEYDF